MTTLIYDGTFEGLLNVVFEIYDRRLTHVKLQKEKLYNSALFEDVIKVSTDQTRARRVLKGLRERLSAGCVQRLYIAHLAGIEKSDDILTGYIRHVFDSGQNIEDDYGNKFVLRVS